MVNRLKEKYTNEIVPSLMEKFNYSSIMQAPKVDKIVINMGVGDAVSNAKNLDEAVEELTLISGQKPVITRAKKSIAGFRLREGMAIGAKVTLRGQRMYEFLDKLWQAPWRLSWWDVWRCFYPRVPRSRLKRFCFHRYCR